MAMHEVFLEKDKAQARINSTPEEREKRMAVDWKQESATEAAEATPLNTLREHVGLFNQAREEAGLNDMFVVTTFHREVVEKLLSQPDTHGLRLYLSRNKNTGSFEPIMVAVNGGFEDLISKDDESGKNFFCLTDSKCPPPAPPQPCPKELLFQPLG